MKNKYCLIDFEYKGTPEKHFPLVSCALHLMPENTKHFFWLYKDEEAHYYLSGLLSGMKDRIHVAFNVSGAEGLCYINLGLNPMDFQWIDLQLEWKQLINSWDRFYSGDQLVKGQVKQVPKAKERYRLSEEQLKKKYPVSAGGPDKSLAAFTYKMLDIDVDLFKKNRLRDMIIYTDEFTDTQKKEIEDYNLSDIDEMWMLLKKAKGAVYRVDGNYDPECEFKMRLKDMLFRGRLSAATAVVAARGYPVDVEALTRLKDSIPQITNEVCEEILGAGHELFKPTKDKTKLEQGFKFGRSIKDWRDYISKSDYAKVWPKTDKGAIELKKDTIQSFFPFKYDYPIENVYAQMIRFLSLQSNLKGLTKTKSGSFFDSVGSDKRSRPFLNPYGSQTGRWQPKSTSFMFLKSAWMRGLVHPVKGRMIGGIDYTSQEVLVAAALSNDEAMLEAYNSGDVYLYFGKEMGVLPQDATKKSHKIERGVCKAAVLGIGFGMGAKKLSFTLTEARNQGVKNDEDKITVSVEEAQEYIDGYYSVFSEYGQYRETQKEKYGSGYPLELKCGWRLYPNNPSPNSVLNFPVQGTASTILRTAFINAVERGLDVLFPLHDALYCEFQKDEFDGVIELDKIMKDACVEVLGDYGKYMRTDIDVWGDDLAKDKAPSHFKVADRYLDERGEREYAMYEKYLWGSSEGTQS